MPKGMRVIQAPVLDNALLRALIAELPKPEKDGFSQPARESWITMARHAFDVVYGPVQIPLRLVTGSMAAPIGQTTRFVPGNTGFTASQCAPGGTGATASRYYVDLDGFAMRDGQPLALNDLPSGVILWDERSGIEAGDADAILWKDIGAVRTGLPAGVRLVPSIEKERA